MTPLLRPWTPQLWRPWPVCIWVLRLLAWKLSELCSILFYGGHLVIYSVNSCGRSRSTCMQNFVLLFSKLSKLCSILFYDGHFVFCWSFCFYSLNVCGRSRSTCMQNFGLLARKLTELWSICVFYLFMFFGFRRSRSTCMQNFGFLAQKLSLLYSILCLYIFTFFTFLHFFHVFLLQTVKIYLHAKFQPSSSKNERVMFNFIFWPPVLVPVPVPVTNLPVELCA